MADARTRSIRLFAALAAVAAVALLTLAPQRFVSPVRWGFLRLMDAATSPLLVAIPWGDAEQILNTVLFIPLGATIGLLLSRRAWPVAILGGFALSAAVEYAQGSIPGRVPDLDDVLWNTVGGAIGVVTVTLVRFAAAAVRRTARAVRAYPGSRAAGRSRLGG